MARTVLRPVATTTCLLAAYFALPLDRGLTAGTVLALAASLAALTAAVTWQARSVMRADYPRLRGAEALATCAPLFLVLFALVHCLVAADDPAAYSEPISRVDALYFSMTVFTTVGFGDIAPRSATARVLTTAQMAGDLLVIGLVGRVFLEAVRRGLDQRER